jgi:hypothetical protein
MCDDGEPREGERVDDRRRRDDGGHGFLDLELSKVLADSAAGLAQRAFKELLFERIKDKLSDRMGDWLDALATFAVDDLMADVEANLEIERRIAARQELRQRSVDGLRRALTGEGE